MGQGAVQTLGRSYICNIVATYFRCYICAVALIERQQQDAEESVEVAQAGTGAQGAVISRDMCDKSLGA